MKNPVLVLRVEKGSPGRGLWSAFVLFSHLYAGLSAASWPQDSVVKAHYARYIASSSASIVLTVAAFISICSYVNRFYCGDGMRKFVEKSVREIWSLRAVLAILLLVIGVGLNFLLVETRYRLWVMLLHTCVIFFLCCMLQLRIPVGLGGLWIGSTGVVAWDATKLFERAYTYGDYAASGIMTGLILVMIIVGSRPSPASPEEKAAEAAADRAERAAERAEAAAATRAEAARVRAAAATT